MLFANLLANVLNQMTWRIASFIVSPFAGDLGRWQGLYTHMFTDKLVKLVLNEVNVFFTVLVLRQQTPSAHTLGLPTAYCGSKWKSVRCRTVKFDWSYSRSYFFDSCVLTKLKINVMIILFVYY